MPEEMSVCRHPLVPGSQECRHLGENIRTEDGMLLPQVVSKDKEMGQHVTPFPQELMQTLGRN